MIAAKMLPLLFALFFGVTSGQLQPPAAKDAPPPVFTEIKKSVLGDRWYGVVIFGKKNFGAVHEVTEAVESGGAPAYKVTTVTDMNAGFAFMKETVIALARPDFTLISMDYKTEAQEPFQKEIKKYTLKCEAESRSGAKCTKTDEGKEPEPFTFETPGGEGLYVTMLPIRAIDWAPGMEYLAYFIDPSKMVLDHTRIAWRGREKITVGGKEVDAVSVSRSRMAGDKEVFDIMLTGANSEIYGSRTDAGGFELSTVLGTKEEAHRDNYVSTYGLPFAGLSPAQVVSRFILAFMKKDRDKVIECLDLHVMYEQYKDETSGKESYEEFENTTKKYFADSFTEEDFKSADAGNIATDKTSSDFMELLIETFAKTEIDGDTATVSAMFSPETPGKSKNFTLNHYKDGWKIDFAMPEEEGK